MRNSVPLHVCFSTSKQLAEVATDPESTAVSSEISDFCEVSDLLLFVTYFTSQSKRIKFGVHFFYLRCVN